jgi:hypothetical protein
MIFFNNYIQLGTKISKKLQFTKNWSFLPYNICKLSVRKLYSSSFKAEKSCTAAI